MQFVLVILIVGASGGPFQAATLNTDLKFDRADDCYAAARTLEDDYAAKGFSTSLRCVQTR